jgi:dCMP deaminase
MIQDRLGREDYFIALSSIAKVRSTCLRLKVGAVLVDRDNRIISTGYNGSPPGEPHCIDTPTGCLMEGGHCIRTVHAETNALMFADDWGRVSGATVYVDGGLPCYHCAKLLITKGVSRVVYVGHHFDPEAEALLERNGVTIDCWNGRTSILVSILLLLTGSIQK